MDADPSLMSFNVILGVLLVDILLSGDNAIVIALVCRSLPKRQQTRVMLLGIAGALLARLLLTSVATLAMQLPLIKLVGGLLLLKISVGLIVDNVDPKPIYEETLEPGRNVMEAAKTIVLADLIMSLDNVLALSAVSQNNFQMLVLGLLLSMPILMFGSLYVSKLLDMFPVFLWIGAAVLGGVAGGLLIDDPVFGGVFSADSSMSHFVLPVLAAAFVVQTSRIVLSNRARVQDLARPPSLYQIFAGGRQEQAAREQVSQEQAAQEQVSQQALPATATLLSVPQTLQAPEPGSAALHSPGAVAFAVSPSERNDVQHATATATATATAAAEATGSTAPMPQEVKPDRDYRVVVALGVFMLLAGWIGYAMVNADPPPVPDRLVGYKCKEPALIVQYRAVAGQIRFATGKGMVDARVMEDRIVWDDYAAASKTLNLKPPMKIAAVQPDQVEFLGGDFEHQVCTVGRR